MHHHKYSLADLENIYPFEFDLYTEMLKAHLEQEREKEQQAVLNQMAR